MISVILNTTEKLVIPSSLLNNKECVAEENHKLVFTNLFDCKTSTLEKSPICCECCEGEWMYEVNLVCDDTEGGFAINEGRYRLEIKSNDEAETFVTLNIDIYNTDKCENC